MMWILQATEELKWFVAAQLRGHTPPRDAALRPVREGVRPPVQTHAPPPCL